MEADERIAGRDLGSTAAFDQEGTRAREYWDDLSGKRLRSDVVRRARQEEME